MRYFLALAQELNFGRAAERLHMAQPPLTRQIRALEEQLGTTLFLRTPKGVELTEAGFALLEEVPNVLLLAERAQERTRQAGQGLEGRLEVGLFTSSVLDVIPRILASFHAERPQVRIGLHTMSKVQQIEALQERRIAIGFNRLVPETSGITVETVLQEPVVVGLHDSHPLCAHKELTLRDLEDQPMILYPNLPISGLAQEVDNAFRREGRRLHVVQEVEDVMTSIALVSAGFGLCITIAPAANLRLPHVVYRPLRSRWLQSFQLNSLYRSDDHSPLLKAFLSHVRAVGAQTADGDR